MKRRETAPDFATHHFRRVSSAAMFHTGDRVLVSTSYGELLAVVLGVVDGTTYCVRPLHPAFVDYRNGIYARDAELRYPMDAAADEPMKAPARLTTSCPASVDPGPWFWPAVKRRVDRPDD